MRHSFILLGRLERGRGKLRRQRLCRIVKVEGRHLLLLYSQQRPNPWKRLHRCDVHAPSACDLPCTGQRSHPCMRLNGLTIALTAGSLYFSYSMSSHEGYRDILLDGALYHSGGCYDAARGAERHALPHGHALLGRGEVRLNGLKDLWRPHDNGGVRDGASASGEHVRAWHRGSCGRTFFLGLRTGSGVPATYDPSPQRPRMP